MPMRRIRLVQCDTSMTPDQGTTSGSQSTPVNFNDRSLAQACATAREVLMKMASERLGVPADQLVAADGAISREERRDQAGHVRGPRRRTTVQRRAEPTARGKPAREWTVLGTAVPRADLPRWSPASSSSFTTFACPGCCTAAWSGRPRWARPLAASTRRRSAPLPGSVKVVVRKNFVGVVAEKPWQAVQAAAALKATWTPGPALPNQRDVLRPPAQPEAVARRVRGRTPATSTRRWPRRARSQGHLSASVSDARIDGHVVRRRRRRSGGKATIWSPTQSAYPLRSGAAMLLGLPPDRRARDLHAGIGLLRHQRRRHRVVRRRAALAGGRPARACAAVAQGRDGVGELRLRLRHRPARRPRSRRSHHRVGLRVVVSGARRPARLRIGPATSSPDCLPASSRPRSRRAPAPTPTAFNNGSNAAPSYVAAASAADSRRHGNDPERTGAHAHRAVAVLHRSAAVALTTAEHVRARVLHGRDRRAREGRPGDFRLRHLRDPRLIDVVKAAAKTAKWEPRPSPAAGRRGAAPSRTAGASPCVLYEGDNGYCAMVAEVDVDQADAAASSSDGWYRPRLRADLESRRVAQSARRRRAPGHEPRARRGSHLGRSAGDLDRLADVSQPAARRRGADRRMRPDQSARRRSDGRRRDLGHAGRGGNRQRHLRRHRRAHSRGAVHARAGQAGIDAR